MGLGAIGIMTTICTDGETIASDTLITDSAGVKHGTFSKLAKLNDGSVVGLAGSPFDLDSFVEWYNGDRTTPWSKEDSSDVLVLSPNGVIRCFNHVGRSYVCTAPQAIGSGAAVAYGAMAMGASPNQAVQVAMKYDRSTGGSVESMKVVICDHMPENEIHFRSGDRANKIVNMSTCNKCERQFPSAPSGTIHKCQCSGGMMVPNTETA